MKMEQTECSETSAYKIQTLGNHPKESIQHVCVCMYEDNFALMMAATEVETCRK